MRIETALSLVGSTLPACPSNFDSRDEVDRALTEWHGAGGRIMKPAEETEWGGYSGYGADLDGNLWEFAHNPFWPLDERGMPQLDGGDVPSPPGRAPSQLT